MSRRRRKKKRGCLTILLLLIILIFCIIGLKHINSSTLVFNETPLPLTAEEEIAAVAEKHNLETSAWPDSLVELLAKNPDARDFVLDYPFNKDKNYEIRLDEFKNSKTVPLLFQWDERWGYHLYGDELMGLSSCGPTCLSMVCIYLLNDVSYNPKYIAEFSEREGYRVPNQGSAWALISEGGRKLGLQVSEIAPVEAIVQQNLEAGNPIICVMGPGIFTETGHFIVLTAYKNGKITINDPNSKRNSEKQWEFSEFKDQICNLWVCSR